MTVAEEPPSTVTTTNHIDIEAVVELAAVIADQPDDRPKSVPPGGVTGDAGAVTVAFANASGALLVPVTTVGAVENTTNAKSKSDRAQADCDADMGQATTSSTQRVLASQGKLGADGCPPKFAEWHTVSNGGVLFALPALLKNGLLHRVGDFFHLKAGYYGLHSIFLALAFMVLAQIKSIEELRHRSPGELGKLIGLDRAPEARTFRRKLKYLADCGQVAEWSNELCREWMMMCPKDAAAVCVDGHVQVYFGKKKLPKLYSARLRLCPRAAKAYWVNAMDGKPFFVVNMAVDRGLLQALEEEIIPRLERDIPNQPSAEQLEADPLLCRFTLVFDREGYSPAFFARAWERRIACLSYHKHPGEDWPRDEFESTEVLLISGEKTTFRLAERGARLSNGLWVREIRKLSKDGHQVSIITTDYRTAAACLAARLLARWSQENFFRYGRRNFNLDALADYRAGEIPDTAAVVNPAQRQLDKEIRSKRGQIKRKQAELGALTIKGDVKSKRVKASTQNKPELQDAIAQLQTELDALKAQGKATKKHILAKELPDDARIECLNTPTKYLMDTIKMITYRAETALVQIVREKMSRSDDGRSLLHAIFRSDADLLPDTEAKTLTVRLHPPANAADSETIRHLCSRLTATKTIFPGTDLRLVYSVISRSPSREQERATAPPSGPLCGKRSERERLRYQERVIRA